MKIIPDITSYYQNLLKYYYLNFKFLKKMLNLTKSSSPVELNLVIKSGSSPASQITCAMNIEIMQNNYI